MVTKQALKCRKELICSVLAKILMVTKQPFFMCKSHLIKWDIDIINVK